MRHSRWLRLVALGLAFASALLSGCARRAPGPDECQHFAELAARMSTDSPVLTSELQAQIDEETRQCLTKPYDRELLLCVETTREAHRCLTAFRLRNERNERSQ